MILLLGITLVVLQMASPQWRDGIQSVFLIHILNIAFLTIVGSLPIGHWVGDSEFHVDSGRRYGGLNKKILFLGVILINLCVI